MEQQIKRLREKLEKIYKSTHSGSIPGYWVVGETEIWTVNSPDDAGGNPVFRAEKRNGELVMYPATSNTKRISVSFRMSADIATKLKEIAIVTGESQTGLVEKLIEQMWEEQKIREKYEMIQQQSLPNQVQNYSIEFITPGKEVMLIQFKPTNTHYVLFTYFGNIEQEWELPSHRKLLLSSAIRVSGDEVRSLVEEVGSKIQNIRNLMLNK